MTDEELIAQLREAKNTQDLRYTLEDAAADRIEQLVKELDKTHEEAMAAIEMWGAALKGQREAEAKLAKAVAALTALANMRTAGDSKGAIAMAWHARAVLAELEKTE